MASSVTLVCRQFSGCSGGGPALHDAKPRCSFAALFDVLRAEASGVSLFVFLVHSEVSKASLSASLAHAEVSRAALLTSVRAVSSD